MPAPVSSSVFPSRLDPADRKEALILEEVFLGRDGARKSTSAATAPLEVDALLGIILGRGKGSVYGTRRRGIAHGLLNLSYSASQHIPIAANREQCGVGQLGAKLIASKEACPNFVTMVMSLCRC